jgi:DNA-binding NtrC family response regulator
MSKKILIIDDEALILTAVERALAKVGYLTVKARNMQELAEAMAHGPFDLLITDVHLDEDSVEDIVKRVKESSPSIPVLMMSGSENIAKFRHFIEKPFSLEGLRNKVKDMLDDSE